jgi:phosphoribosylglycinamide formyltransferase-1
VLLGILASGRGSNLRNLVDRGFDVAAVATNRPACPAAEFARDRGLALGIFMQKSYGSAAERDAAMAAWLRDQGVELVVAAGWDRVLSDGFVAAFPDRVINIHPSLLPAFAGGMDAVEQALAQGVKVTGCTVHLVTRAVDAGPILHQAAVPVLEGDTPATLHERIQREEHRILPEAIHLMETEVRSETRPSDSHCGRSVPRALRSQL